MNPEISLGSATSAVISGHTTASQAVADIQSGKWSKQIHALRSATGEDRDRLKRNLPAFLFSGKFRERNKAGLIQHSGQVCADIDKVPDRVGELHDLAHSDPHAAAAFVSPSGTGIKIIFRTDNFDAVRAHVKKFYNADVDEAAKDVSRLCFVSHDPAAFFNPDAVPLPTVVEHKAELAKPLSSSHPAKRSQIAEKILGTIQWTDSTGFCKCPGEHLHTAGNSPRDCQVKIDGAPTLKCFHNSCAGILDGVNHELRSQIGKAEFVPASPTRATIGEHLDSFRFNIKKNAPPEEPSVFEVNRATFATRGNLSAVTAQAKAGKSAWLTALCASTIAPNPDDCDLLGVRAVNPEGLPVLLLDTEHSPFHHHALCDRILRRAMLTESELLHAYRLAGFSVPDLNAALEYLIADRKWLAVILDGTGDFVADVNDPEECNSFVARLHGLAIQNDTHILNVLHLNPGSDFKSRGHLGSQLERKAESNIRIEKTDEVSVVFADKNRGSAIPKSKGPRFAWSSGKMMHVSVATKDESKEKIQSEDAVMKVREAFRLADKTQLHYADLIRAILAVPGVKSESTAERLYTKAKAAGIITKNIISKWELTP